MNFHKREVLARLKGRWEELPPTQSHTTQSVQDSVLTLGGQSHQESGGWDCRISSDGEASVRFTRK